jgi:hypothetical protein
MLAVGFVPLYFEIWKRRGRVAGVSKSYTTYRVCSSHMLTGTACTDWVFVSLDSLGALFSLFALGKSTSRSV